jgi:hypothetical protein
VQGRRGAGGAGGAGLLEVLVERVVVLLEEVGAAVGHIAREVAHLVGVRGRGRGRDRDRDRVRVRVGRPRGGAPG